MASVTRENVETAIAGYVDPYLEQDLVVSKCVKDVRIDGASVAVDVVLGFPAKGYQEQLVAALDERIRADERQDARETIYEALFKISVAGTIDFGESRLLERLAEAWSLELEEAPED